MNPFRPDRKTDSIVFHNGVSGRVKFIFFAGTIPVHKKKKKAQK